ncbi:SAM-dependent methyltransferase [Clostridium carboxidivorans P7]|uniref:Cyclopropane-fatty-acyl-phospholipid synthase n=1 Tax=Clostridium carboxidivorans P7 TaxID=536227 RepID=C6PYX7_9CLOT|nr:cyclopropane-fatty-acyl-phospholipid synthase family protein [Clostridium carboxidivorans]AKN33161.1 SAM-dependent methyltransferase [Clostridium carboxidivorans P7]EET85560.1 Cyclopropane-fatty-acyl-phospholipid synthase [Clostridium carboxidivorans P7]
MSIDKIFYKNLFKNLFSDTCEVRFWDGEVEKYGEGESKFTIVFNEHISKADIIRDPFITFGEGYMTKKLDIEGDVQKVIESLYNNKESFLSNGNKYMDLIKRMSNTIKNSKEYIQHHYDIGNDFYKLWLDSTMTYSCGYFKANDDSLETAQKNKVRHILKKLCLEEGQTLLDIGCGWGELIITAAKQYKVKAMGITLSSEQFAKVNERIKDEGLEDLVQVKLTDYRELENVKFDRIVSVGMVEHVGKEHIGEYFNAVNNLLNEKGVSMLHCITAIGEGGTNTWIDKHIFPGGYIPSVKELIDNMTDYKFYLNDVESLRRHYGRTLEYWARNFENALPEIRKTKDETFIRMWRLYLDACAASFNCGNIDIHQFLFVKGVNNELPWTREYMYA